MPPTAVAHASYTIADTVVRGYTWCIEHFACTGRSDRSILFLPLATPWDPYVLMWAQIILALDLTYTAFLVPILVGFEESDINWGWGEWSLSRT